MNKSERKREIQAGLNRTRSDLSIQTLIVSNLIVMIWALIERWPIFTIMWIYWIQSASIGIFWSVKIIFLKRFTTKGFYISSKILTSFFFLVHYSCFHVGYAVFLAKAGKSVEPVLIILAGSIFFANQLFSFLYNRQREDMQRPNLGKLMFFPYVRIMPMHITVMVASALRDAEHSFITLGVFLLLKTVADVATYIRQLKGFSDWPSSKLDDAGHLVQVLTGKDRHRKFAKKIHEQMKKAYVGKHEYKTVRARNFYHLDLGYYNKVTKELKTQGFSVLGDIEDRTLSRLHPQIRTLIRCMVSRDGTIEGDIYLICNAGCSKVLQRLDYSRAAKIIDLRTEFSNGCFLLTTNSTETVSTAPRILIEYLPLNSCVMDLLQMHKQRVNEYKTQNPQISVVSISSLEDAVDSVNRQNMIFASYGKFIPGIVWEMNKIAESELQNISVEGVVYEMRKLRDLEEGKIKKRK